MRRNFAGWRRKSVAEVHLALTKDQNLAGMKVIREFRSELAELRKRMYEKEFVIARSRAAE
jgi:hypothetical protein